MVVAKQLVQEVKGFRGDKVLVLSTHEFGPGLATVPANQLFKLRIQLQSVLVQVVKQFICAQDLYARLITDLYSAGAAENSSMQCPCCFSEVLSNPGQ